MAYRRFNDYDNELRIINKYMNGESARTKISDEWFEKRLEMVNKKLKTDYSVEDLKSQS